MIITGRRKRVVDGRDSRSGGATRCSTVLLPHAIPSTKVTIIPARFLCPMGRSASPSKLQAEEKQQTVTSRRILNDQIRGLLLGGGAAFAPKRDSRWTGPDTTGGRQRISEGATEHVAQDGLAEWGMSDAMGPAHLRPPKEEQIFSDAKSPRQKDYSEDTALKTTRKLEALFIFTDKLPSAHQRALMGARTS